MIDRIAVSLVASDRVVHNIPSVFYFDGKSSFVFTLTAFVSPLAMSCLTSVARWRLERAAMHAVITAL